MYDVFRLAYRVASPRHVAWSEAQVVRPYHVYVESLFAFAYRAYVVRA